MSYTPDNPFPSWSRIDQDECLIVEELCRVIARAKRFQTIEEAWKAIQATRRIARKIRDETIEDSGGGQCDSEAAHAEPGE